MAAVKKRLLGAGIATGLLAGVGALAFFAQRPSPEPPAPVPVSAPTQSLAAAGCRVPDTFLSLSGDLDHTESLVTRRHPVRVVVLSSSLGSQDALERALEKRLPGSQFTVEAVLSTGLAEHDAQSLRAVMATLKPDLVVWQVGLGDALAASDMADFGAALGDAVSWVEKAGTDILLVDPPFVPRVRHEQIYAPYVGRIAEIAQTERVPVLKRYALMRYLSERPERALPPADATPCAVDLMAEAITRSLR